MNVLLVSYYFPPNNVIAALRVGKWAKYLPLYGVTPWVLTLDTGIFPSAGELAVEMPETQVIRADLGHFLTAAAKRRQNRRFCVDVVQAGSDNATDNIPNKPSYPHSMPRKIWDWFSAQCSDVRLPDRALPWVMPAIRKGTALMRDQTFDVILSSHGPPSSHLVAAFLSRRFNVPWVADFRDLWTLNHIRTRGPILQWMETGIERRVLSGAQSLITVSEPLADQLRELHHKTVNVIPNGFDEEDFSGSCPQADSSSFRIVYTGSIYPGKQDPTPLFEAVSVLQRTHPEVAQHVQIYFLGTVRDHVVPLAQRHGLESRIHFLPRCANIEALRWQRSADILLLLEWNDPSAKGVYTGKIFEYLGARRPILAIGSAAGVVDDLLRTTSGGVVVNTSSNIKNFIIRCWYQKLRIGSTMLNTPPEFLKSYTRRYQAGMLADHLRSAIYNTRHP